MRKAGFCQIGRNDDSDPLASITKAGSDALDSRLTPFSGHSVDGDCSVTPEKPEGVISAIRKF